MTGRLTQSMGVYSRYRLEVGVVPLMIALYCVCVILLPEVVLVVFPEPRDSHLKLLKSKFCSNAGHEQSMNITCRFKKHA